MFLCPKRAHATTFQITVNANGTGTLNACTGTCAFAPGADNGAAVTNVSGLGGNGFDFRLPTNVSLGNVQVDNSGGVLAGVLDFVDSTDLVFLTSGNLANYTGTVITANPSGTATLNAGGAYPTGNTYVVNLALAAAPVPEPGTLALVAPAVAGLGAMWRRRRQR